MTATEFLVVLDAAAPAAALGAVRRLARVTHTLPPRLALVRTDEPGEDEESGHPEGVGLDVELGALPGVFRVCAVEGEGAPEPAGEVPGAGLDERERQFVAAWRARAHPHSRPPRT